jgi:hypothetical protein
MKNMISPFFAVLVLLLVFAFGHRAEAVCVQANGLNWCYDNGACGEACDAVCAALGMKVIDDDQVWFEAQNTPGECEVISQALGLGGAISFGVWGYACLEDSGGNHSVGGGLIAPLFCSSVESCPPVHRTLMDQLDTPCGPDSRRSVCPCEAVPPQFINLSPDSSSGPAGTEQTVTATVTEEGSPLPGVLVTFEVVSGPGAGRTSASSGECSNPGCFTGPDGLVSWSYTVYGVGTNTVTASLVNTLGTVVTSAPVEVIWEVLPIPALSTWGLVAAAGLIGAAGLLYARRRKAAV